MPNTGYDKLRVLVVDDFDSFRSTVAQMLHSMGIYEVDNAFNGEEALKRCQQNHYDIVLCDYNLGRGKNGQQVLEALRFGKLLAYDSLFVLISAEASKSIVLSAYDYEPDAYLAKPITARALEQRLDRLLQQRDELGEILLTLHDDEPQLAMTLLESKIESGSRYTSNCQKLLGKLYIDQGLYAKAEALYNKVLQARMLDWAQVGLARVKKAQGDFDTARRWLQDIVNTNPLCMQAYDALVEAFEEQGEAEQVQAVLMQAVEISPLSILRQRHLAEVAMENNDLGAAASAFRRTVRLGEHSCYDQIENHLNFGRTSAAFCRQVQGQQAEDEARAREFLREALRVLESVGLRFKPNRDEGLQSLFIESQLFAGQGRTEKADELLKEAEAAIKVSSGQLQLLTELDFVQALMTSGEKAKSRDLLHELVEKYRGDEPALEKIDHLLDEPLSRVNRERVARINREGISLYDKRAYREAIDAFSRAQRLFPNHIGVQLNLVQAMIGEMRTNGRDQVLMGNCQDIMKQVELRLSPGDEQFPRFRQLMESAKLLK